MGLTTLIIPTLILLAGVAGDLRSRKVKNSLVIVSAIIAIGVHFYFSGTQGLVDGGLAFVTALALTLPLVLARVLGAGDMKLLAAFALSLNWYAVFVTVVGSLFWGAILGVTRAILAGQGLTMVKNTVAILKGVNSQTLQTTKIPFTVALLFGWLTFVSLEFHGGRL